MTRKVLIIDDDPALVELVELILKPLDITVCVAFSGSDGLRQAYKVHPDLVIVDLMLPGMNGFEVCSRLREFASFPIMILSARTSEADVAQGFKVGANDYLRKPFSHSELEARVWALLRRSNSAVFDDSYITAYTDRVLEVNLLSKMVKINGKSVDLSPKEYDLLALLVREQRTVISHREMVREVWGGSGVNNPSESSLYIHYLRKKLKDGQFGHQYIRTYWGRGYWFEPRSSEELA